MERQATQPAAVPSGRKRRRVSSKKPKGEEEAQAPAVDMKATRELEMALTRPAPSRPTATPYILPRLFRPRADGGNPERL